MSEPLTFDQIMARQREEWRREQEQSFANLDIDGAIRTGHRLSADLWMALDDSERRVRAFDLVNKIIAKYGVITPPEASAAEPVPEPAASSVETLIGSSILPAHIDLAPGVTITLGDLVCKAHENSGLSVDDWNGLPDDERETRLQATLNALRLDADDEQTGDDTQTGTTSEPAADAAGATAQTDATTTDATAAAEQPQTQPDPLAAKTKRELETYAKEKHGVDLDLRLSKDALIEQVRDLDAKAADAAGATGG